MAEQYYYSKVKAKVSVELEVEEATMVRNTSTDNHPPVEHVSRKNMIQDRWTPPVQPNYPKPEFHPPYLSGNDSVSNAINAAIEIRALWEYVIKDAYYSYSDIYSQLSYPITNTVMEICKKHKQAFAVYDKKTRTWLIESNEPEYKYCYNGNDFKEFYATKNKIGGNRLLLVGQFTTLMQEPNLLRDTRTVLTSQFYMPDIRLIVGVPGCGKTSFIINNHLVRSLVLTSCTEGAEDIRSRMGEIKNCESSSFRGLYRTIDSYLLHSRRPARDVWMDEALMEHPGKIFLMCQFSRCDRLFLLGDHNQLGYVNRVSEIELLYDKSSIFFRPASTLNTSYRCPVDVMAVLSSKYEGGTYSKSTVLRSMTCEPFTSLEGVPKINGTKYLVFRQAEKKKMRNKGYNVSTIHEFQGKEAKNVVIVRMSKSLRGWPYDSSPHILVGLSRHTESLVYYTPVADGLKKLIKTPLTDEDLRRHMAPNGTIPKRPITISSNGNSQIPSNGYSQIPSNGYSQTPSNGYSQIPSNGYSKIPSNGYSKITSNGYSPIPSNGYSQTPSNGYSQIRSNGYSQNLSNGYSQIRSNGYSQIPSNGYSQTPRTAEPSFIGTIMRGIANVIATSIFRSVVNMLWLEP